MTAKILTILILSFVAGGAVLGAEQDAQTEREEFFPLLREGFVLDGVEGTVIRADEEKDKWLFTPDVDVSDGRGIIKAAQPIELLPSSTLEKIIAGIEEAKTTAGIRLWATVTRYSNRHLLTKDTPTNISFHEDFFDKNFLLAWYFIPMSEIEEPQRKTETDEIAAETPASAEQSQDDAIIPVDVMAKLKPKRMVNLAKLKKLDITGDVMLADRTGFVVAGQAGKMFKIDGLGRNVEDISFRLLPCEVLERTEANLARSAYRQRYRIAGRLTKYKGRFYLLLKRAVRTYNHGNFAR